MRTKIVRIGNSQGVRIPKEVLAQAGLLDAAGDPVEVTMTVSDEGVLIRPAAALSPVDAFFEWAEWFRKETGGVELDIPPREFSGREIPFSESDAE
jgi:antitoxin component of MazEF toxin-antitoxin module